MKLSDAEDFNHNRRSTGARFVSRTGIVQVAKVIPIETTTVGTRTAVIQKKPKTKHTRAGDLRAHKNLSNEVAIVEITT